VLKKPMERSRYFCFFSVKFPLSGAFLFGAITSK
jgi:hypothetical protein